MFWAIRQRTCFRSEFESIQRFCNSVSYSCCNRGRTGWSSKDFIPRLRNEAAKTWQVTTRFMKSSHAL